MELAALFGTICIAHRSGKQSFFFSRFNFDKMREVGNTHYCFHCGGRQGFTPGPHGVAQNCEEESGYNPMEHHDPVRHADAVIGDANRYSNAHEWLEAKIGSDFPYVISMQSTW
jgi:hypothetical protein